MWVCTFVNRLPLSSMARLFVACLAVAHALGQLERRDKPQREAVGQPRPRQRPEVQGVEIRQRLAVRRGAAVQEDAPQP